LYPLGAFTSVNDDLVYSPLYETRTMLSPLCYAALQGLDEAIRFLFLFRKEDEQRDLDFALFLANRSGHLKTADLLLSYGANPGQESFSNGLHGAAWRGLKSVIYHYINNLHANPDINDASFTTPVTYAMLNKQDEQDAWDTIECLFGLGANPLARFGNRGWTCADLAWEMGKKDLAQRLEDFAKSGSPSISTYPAAVARPLGYRYVRQPVEHCRNSRPAR
ncbi:uncharacterized protein FOBCDRAFT_127330, partial [Fusarium oxysporum Fo47]|uniref:uncharacterized protein n=1 Tax=Fusarium oxysporum Fo47 TaxID=660027 RepID=UPI002869B5C6